MNRRTIPTKLINFRTPKTLIAPFDDMCFNAGKTRTQMLCRLMEEHVADANLAMVLKKPSFDEDGAKR